MIECTLFVHKAGKDKEKRVKKFSYRQQAVQYRRVEERDWTTDARIGRMRVSAALPVQCWMVCAENQLLMCEADQTACPGLLSVTRHCHGHAVHVEIEAISHCALVNAELLPKVKVYLKAKGVQTQEAADATRESLVTQVKDSWYETEENAQLAYEAAKDWIFDTWSESQLKEFCDKHDIPGTLDFY